MPDVAITVGRFSFTARFEEAAAPRTCAVMRRLLPLRASLLHVRWSGEGVWVPLGDAGLDLPAENATAYPLPGEILLYPGGVSEAEILIPYGRVHFGSKAGELVGNHVFTIVSGAEQLPELGRAALWEGAQSLTISQI